MRLARLRVRGELPYARALGADRVCSWAWSWWCGGFSRAANRSERIVQPLILPSPMEVLQAFVPAALRTGPGAQRPHFLAAGDDGFRAGGDCRGAAGGLHGHLPAGRRFLPPAGADGRLRADRGFHPAELTWFGTGETQKIGFLFIGCFVALLPLVIKDIADVPAAFLDVAVTKGATQWQLVRHVLFPVAQANIWDHLRGVYGVGWGWIIMAEVFVRPEYGLGDLIDVSERRSHTDSIFAVIIVIVLIAVACDQLWRLGGELLFPYRKTEK